MRPLLLALALASGAAAQDLPVGFGFEFNRDADGGTLVTGVAPGGAADEAGLRAGDRIRAIGGAPLPPDQEGALDALRAARADLPATLLVDRDGEALTLSLGVAPYDPEATRRASAAFFCLAGNCWDGRGLWRHPSGDWYEGGFRDGRRHGGGTVTLADGRVYSGRFAGGTPNGRGVYRWPDNTYWTGLFVDDEPQPPGVYTDAAGRSRPGLPD